MRDASYRFGFNGKEKDSDGEWGNSAHYDYGFRIYDPSIARFLSVDPLTQSYPWYTPYQFAGNKPIMAVDLDGLEEEVRINSVEPIGKEFVRKVNAKEITTRREALNFVYDWRNSKYPNGIVNKPWNKEKHFEWMLKASGGKVKNEVASAISKKDISDGTAQFYVMTYNLNQEGIKVAQYQFFEFTDEGIEDEGVETIINIPNNLGFDKKSNQKQNRKKEKKVFVLPP